MEPAEVLELRVREGRPVFTAAGAAAQAGTAASAPEPTAGTPAQAGEHAGDGHAEAHADELATEQLSLGDDLTTALHEWARVSAVVTAGAAGVTTGLHDAAELADGVTRRGEVLARRIAARLDSVVRVIDPVSGSATVAEPHPGVRPERGRFVRRVSLLRSSPGEPTPWGPGLVVSVFAGAFVFVSMLAFAGALSGEQDSWVALGAAALVTGGLAPSLWFARRVPLLRWVCFGVAGGLVLSWLALLLSLLG